MAKHILNLNVKDAANIEKKNNNKQKLPSVFTQN